MTFFPRSQGIVVGGTAWISSYTCHSSEWSKRGSPQCCPKTDSFGFRWCPWVMHRVMIIPKGYSSNWLSFVSLAMIWVSTLVPLHGRSSYRYSGLAVVVTCSKQSPWWVNGLSFPPPVPVTVSHVKSWISSSLHCWLQMSSASLQVPPWQLMHHFRSIHSRSIHSSCPYTHACTNEWKKLSKWQWREASVIINQCHSRSILLADTFSSERHRRVHPAADDGWYLYFLEGFSLTMEKSFFYDVGFCHSNVLHWAPETHEKQVDAPRRPTTVWFAHRWSTFQVASITIKEWLNRITASLSANIFLVFCWMLEAR